MITLIGTGHLFNLKKELIRTLHSINPDLICIELDKQRYDMLMMKRSDPDLYNLYKKQLPILPKIFLHQQEKIAKSSNINQGDEMLIAIEYANSHNIPFEYIDQSQKEIYEKVLNSISIVEKIMLFIDGTLFIFLGFLSTNKKLQKIFMEKIEQDYDSVMLKYEKKFPKIKKIFLDERNEYMANKLKHLNKKYENIVACTGDLHVSGISKILDSNDIKHDVISLSALVK